MKKLISVLIILFVLYACSTAKPQEQTDSNEVYNEIHNNAQPQEEEYVEEDVEERKAVDRSVKLNRALLEMMDQRIKKHTNVKGYLTQSDLNKNDFDNEQALQPFPFITYDTQQHPKVDGAFTLHFLNGDSLVFYDIPEKYGDALTTYKYIGFANNLKKYIVSVMFWENNTCLLIDQHDGTMRTFESIPLFNKRGTAMMTYEDNIYEELTGYYIYNLNGKSIDVAHRLVTDYQYPEDYYWKNDSTLNLKATTVDEDTVYHILHIAQDR